MTLAMLIESRRKEVTPEERLAILKEIRERQRKLDEELRRVFKSMEVSDELLNKRCTI